MTAFLDRRKSIEAKLEEQHCDCLVVTALPNVHYLSGFTGSNAVLILHPGRKATLFTDPRYTVQAGQETDCAVKIVRGPLMARVAKVLNRNRSLRAGFERNRISFNSFSDLQESLGPQVTLQPVSALVETARMTKSAQEIESIRSSMHCASKALDRAIARWKPGMRESELAAEVEYLMRRNGADKPAFETIVASGPHSALPHAAPRLQTIENNRLLLIDMGAMLAGYASDMTRTFHVGKPSSASKHLYAAVLDSQLAAIDHVRAGVTGGSVDRIARQALRKHRLEELFVHSTGHGLGLEIHEAPRLGKKDKTVLEAGMVITIEPGAYRQGFGGVRIEDTVVVTQTGCEVLTHNTKDFVIL